MFNPYVLLAGIIVIIGAFLGGYKAGYDMSEGQSAREERIAMQARDEALRVTATAIAGIEVKNTTIRQTVEREVRENTIYKSCAHTDDGLRLVNQALGNKSVGDSKLPKPNRTK